MKHAQFIASILSQPWALQREMITAYANVLVRKYAVEVSEPQAAVSARSSSPGKRSGNIAVLPLFGTILQRAGMLDMCTGATSVQSFTASLRQAMADETIDQILIEIDSPGGSVYGVGELADEIIQARKSKPIIAIANSLAASAAYWVGCSASEFYVTPGGEVGSIGVWQAHEDWSNALEEEGVKVTLISAGKYKTEGNPYAPLDEEAKAFMQSRTQDYYDAFVKAVARGRSVGVDHVRNGMGQGRVLGADAALSEHMVDGVMTMDEVIKKMQRSAKASRSALKAAQADLQILG